MIRNVPLLLLAVAVAACNREAPQPPATAAPSAHPSALVAPALAPLTASGTAHVDGYGKLRFGMSADQVRTAWAGDLDGKPGPGEICYYLAPRSADAPRALAFMIESDTFARYDVHNDHEIAPGGGRRGMSADEIRRLYAGRSTETPHKYVKGGSYLRIKTKDASGGVLLFETGADGKVTTWRVGQAPQVDYVEGCS